jgi:hypothetical protein
VRLLRDAEQLLDAASAAADSGTHAICIDRQGAIRVMPAEGWTLSALAADSGAEAAYRIERRNGAVTVEGWSGGASVVLRRYATRQVLGL